LKYPKSVTDTPKGTCPRKKRERKRLRRRAQDATLNKSDVRSDAEASWFAKLGDQPAIDLERRLGCVIIAEDPELVEDIRIGAIGVAQVE
jgi:hypothetical protein